MTDNRTTELLPCPFCGSKAHMCEMESGYGTEYAICCNYKGCRLSEHPRFGRACKTESEAIAAWNTRHVETCENESLEFFGTDSMFKCSACDEDYPDLCDFNYCPFCGAKVVDNAD